MTSPAPPGHDPHEGDIPAVGGHYALPPLPLVWRGLALGVSSVFLGCVAVRLVRASVVLAPVAAVCLAAAGLAGWGGAIELTGGVRNDDHPWI